MQDTATLRRTSVYSLRIAQDRAGGDEALARLVAKAEDLGHVVTDTHAATLAGIDYISISVRIPTSDADAIDLAGALLVAAGLADRETYLHTGLGVHRRLIDFRAGHLPTCNGRIAANGAEPICDCPA